MQCPSCGSKTEQLEMTYLTAVRPKETHNCSTCARKFMIFEVVGEEDLIVWIDEKDPTTSFTDFVEGKLRERQRQKMH